MRTTPLVLVLVGTDHHPFDRLISWIDDWIATEQPEADVVAQYGSSCVPRRATGHPILSRDDLDGLLDRADVIVSHGGPATINEIRSRSRLPIVVPRDARHGEHVDNHQVRFARRMGASGYIHLCEDRDTLVSALDTALSDPAFLYLDNADRLSQQRKAIAATTRTLDELVTSGLRRRRSFRKGRDAVSAPRTMS